MSDIKRIDNTKRPTDINLNKEDFPDYKTYKKEYDRQYSLMTRERRKEIYALNKDYKKQQQKDWVNNNPDKLDKFNETRRTKYKNKGEKFKQSKIWTWKRAGIILNDDTYEKFYNTTHCELCNKEFCEIGGKTKHNKGCLDHDHLTGHVRCICCFTCNNYLKSFDNKRFKINLELHRYFNRL
jgi:hypothetical protein